MKLTAGFSITLTALKAHKTRNFLASLGVVIGIASVVIMVAIGKGSQQEVMDVIANMGENLITINAGEMKRRGGRLRLTGNVTTLNVRDSKVLLEAVAELERVAPFHGKQMRVKWGNAATETMVAGTTPEFLHIKKYETEQGQFFDEKDLRLNRRVAVIGHTTIKNLFGEEDPIGQTVRIQTVPFTVIGVFRAKGLDTDGVDQDDILVVPLNTLLRRVLNQTFISTIYAQATSRQAITPALERIREVLRERHKLTGDRADDFTVMSQLDLEELKRETSELFTRLIVGVAAISLVVGGIGILAVMLISVKERTREIGIRRAVGATQGNIVLQFLLESLTIGFFGGLVGIALGVGITLGLVQWGPWTLILDLHAIFLATGVCVLIGLVFGIFPAVKASQLDPMDALRVE